MKAGWEIKTQKIICDSSVPVRGELVEPHPSTSSGRTDKEDSL
jgi:hypothetical protein